MLLACQRVGFAALLRAAPGALQILSFKPPVGTFPRPPALSPTNPVFSQDPIRETVAASSQVLTLFSDR